jgi:hypothetical protein
VRDSSALVAALQKAVEVSPLTGREVVGVDAGLVVYNQDEEITDTPDSDTRTRLTYFQKSRSFSEQCECRFVVQMSGPLFNAPEFLDLELGSLEEFAELLPPRGMASGIGKLAAGDRRNRMKVGATRAL